MIKLKTLLFENIKTINDVKQVLPQLIKAAQQVYDEWQQDDEGYDEELGHGGICQDIAEAISGVLSDYGIETAVVDNNGMGDQHVWTVAQLNDGIYEIDIPPHLYERGSGYTWKKIPNVRFDETFIHMSKMPPEIKWKDLIDY